MYIYYIYCIYTLYIVHIYYICCIYILYIYKYIYVWTKKTQIIYLKEQIFLFFSEALLMGNHDFPLIKLLKRREIFVLLNKLCDYVCFFVYIFQVTHLELAFI